VTDSHLLVPVHLDAMVLNAHLIYETPFLRFKMDYRRLATSFESPMPKPFAGASGKQPPPGVYLHWTLPAALRHGSQDRNDPNKINYHYLPTRWLVVRVQQGQPAARSIKAWVLESDYIGPESGKDAGSNPFVDPFAAPDGTPTPKTLGRSHLLSDLQTGTAQLGASPLQPFLQALGPSNVIFTVYSPGVDNVLSFYDDITDLAGASIDTATFSYYVVGWYDDKSHDPLRSASWQPKIVDGKPSSRVLVADQLDWVVNTGGAAPPDTSLLHALVCGVPWQRNGANPPPDSFPTDVPKDVRVSVGHTAIDALAAMVRTFRSGKQHEADLLEAFAYDLLEEFDQPGSSRRLNDRIRERWFGARPGGTRWSVVDTTRDNTGEPTPKPIGPPGQAARLAALNQQQRDVDKEQRILESMQWQLYALWWKYKWVIDGANQPANLPDDWSSIVQELMTQIGSGTSPACAQPGGDDPNKEQLQICRVRAQMKKLDGLQGGLTQAKAAVPLAKGQALKELPMPQFFGPNDPVVLVTGLGRSSNFDPVGELNCRLSSQCIQQLTVNHEGTKTWTSADLAARGVVPLLDDPKQLLPGPAATLNMESFFLSPSLFAVNAIGDAAAAGAVSAAIKALEPKAGYVPEDKPHLPLSFSREPWVQPWVPLLLDWQVTVLSDKSFNCVKSEPSASYPYCTLDQDNWEFNGSDFIWKGPEVTDAVNGVLTLTGRTFVTPQTSFSLTAKLAQYIRDHKERNPELEDLEAYLESLEGHDILSQRLGGMSLQMVQRSTDMSVPPSGSMAALLGDQTHSFPKPNDVDRTTFTPPPFEFTPMRAGFFLFQKLQVIDSFGRTIDLIRANCSTYQYHEGSNVDPATFFYPIGGRNLVSPWLEPPCTGQGASNGPAPRSLQLGPRVVQDTRLDFVLTTADGSNAVVDVSADATPVCAWVVPNHLDRSLAFYDDKGTAWGELFLSQHARDHWVLVWTPAPNNPNAPKSIDTIPNDYVKQMLLAVTARTDEGQGLNDFMQVIDESLWTVNPLGRRKDQDLSVLIGRPLAIVRGRLSFMLRGLPYYNQDWQYTFDLKGGDGSDPSPIATKDGGIFDHRWPICLGSNQLRDDGLMGYFLERDFGTFNAVHVPADVKSSYIAPVGVKGNFIRLKINDESNPAPEEQYITFLLDPRASVHAYTGVLPVLRVDLPQVFMDAAFENMCYSFRSGPIITDPDAVHVPPPAEQRGDWAWFDEALGSSPLAPTSDRARFPRVAPSLREGWLTFKPKRS
jgi:hypothetical protein